MVLRWLQVFERFTDGARRVLVLAQEEARLLNHNFIGTEHVLLGLVRDEEGIAGQALRSLGVSLVAVREQVEETIGPSGNAPIDSPPFTPRAKKVLELSLREALDLKHNYIGTEHLLLGLLREGEGVSVQVLVGLGVDLSSVRERVLELLGTETTEGIGEESIQRERRAGPPLPGQPSLGRMPRRRGPMGEGPACPTCNTGLTEGAVWSTLSVASAETDGEPHAFTVVHCRVCGATLAVLPAERHP
jgi:ATP-dependent Clp protease ATP-binding subunit ClpC